MRAVLFRGGYHLLKGLRNARIHLAARRVYGGKLRRLVAVG